jgi:hypothetical protein
LTFDKNLEGKKIRFCDILCCSDGEAFSAPAGTRYVGVVEDELGRELAILKTLKKIVLFNLFLLS